MPFRAGACLCVAAVAWPANLTHLLITSLRLAGSLVPMGRVKNFLPTNIGWWVGFFAHPKLACGGGFK